MSKKLYVGNLPFSMSENSLHTMFSQEGTVTSTKLIADKFSGQSRGFGFVEMSDDAEAEAVITKLHNAPLEGRNLVVNEARPMKERKFSGGGGGNKRGSFSKGNRW